MPKAVNISYHTYAMLRLCRYRYQLSVVDKKKPAMPEDNRNAIFGHITQRLFEHFYVQEWFRLGKGATQKLYDELPATMREQLAKNPCLWEHRSEIELLERDCQDAIPKFIKAVREYALIGEKNQSEVSLCYPISKEFNITGRADFLIHKGKDLILLDGKGTKYGDKYLDEDQLLYYGVIFRQLKMRRPTRAGFWLWREANIKWIDFSEERLEELYTKIKEVLFFVQKRDFGANPSTKACKFCPYQVLDCSFYADWHKKNQQARASKRPDLHLPDPGEDAILEIF